MAKESRHETATRTVSEKQRRCEMQTTCEKRERSEIRRECLKRRACEKGVALSTASGSKLRMRFCSAEGLAIGSVACSPSGSENHSLRH